MSGYRVYQDVNPRYGVVIFGPCFVQVHEVYTHPPLSIDLFDHYYVGQLVGVVNLPNEFCILKFANLFGYGLVLFLGEYLLLLSNRGERG